jgi:hypothetical protein
MLYLVHLSCQFEYHSWRGVLDTTWCDKGFQWLAAVRWFSDRHSSFYLQNGFVSTLYIFCNLLWVLAHLTERKCELFPSLGVCRLLTFHILLFFSETPSQINRHLVGSIYGRSSIKIVHFVLIRSTNLLLWNRLAKWTETL